MATSSKKKNSKSPVTKKELKKMIVEADPQPLGRVLYLTGEVTEESVSTLVSEIIMCVNQSKSEPITLIINTEGGSVDDMFALYDVIKFVPCPIYTVGLGKVMSAGVLILASGVKGGRMLGKHASFMIHPISSEISGDVFQMANEMKETQRIQKMFEDAILAETKMTPKQLETLMKTGQDVYLSSEEALKFGLVDKIIG